MKIGSRAVWFLLAVLSAASVLSAQPKQPQPKSQKELEAIQAMFNAQDPDGRIKAAQELIQKFADTEFKSIAFQMIAMSYQMKNDVENMVIWSERVLEAEPKNFNAMLMIATGLAQRTREFDLDKEEKLTRAEKLAKSADEIVKTAPKPRPDLADEQWEAAKKDYSAQAHEALGLIATARKKPDVAIAEYKLAIEGAANPDPATMVRLGAAYNTTGKPDEAIAVLDKVITMTEVHPQIKQFAQAEKSRAMQLKTGAKPAAPAPAAPAAPAAPKP
jgi:tetratricopeptide (TPR) repeat protein